MALDTGAGVIGVVVTAHLGTTAADGSPWILFKNRGLKVGEMAGLKRRSVMTVSAGNGNTISIDINRPSNV